MNHEQPQKVAGQGVAACEQRYRGAGGETVPVGFQTPVVCRDGVAFVEKATIDETRSIVTRVSQGEISAMIRSALDRLGEEKRQVVVLRLLENKTNQEIAELLDLKPNTVAVRYARALEELREFLLPGLFPDA